MGYLFISYSHDDRKYVHQLAEMLEREGFRVWIDDRLDYGSDWPIEIQQRLDACDALVLIMSSRALASKWVQNELNRALRKGKPVFPLLLEGREPWLAVESTQYVDVTNGRMPEEKFYELLAQVTPRRKELTASKQLILESSPEKLIKAGRAAAMIGKKEETESEQAKLSEQTGTMPRERLVTRKTASTKEKLQKRAIPESRTLYAVLVLLLCIVVTLIAALFVVPRLIEWLKVTSTPTNGSQLFGVSPPSDTRTPSQGTTVTKTSIPEGTPKLPTIRVVRQFDAPGDDPGGLAWDGTNLWVCSMNRVMRLDEAGNTLNIYFGPVSGVLWNCGGSFASIAGNLWVAGDYPTWGLIGLYELSVVGEDLEKTNTIPVSAYLNSGTRALTWDGQNFWLAQDFSVYKIDLSGNIIDHFIYPSTTPIIGLVSDGNFFWVSKGLINAGKMLEVTDDHGKLLASFSLPEDSGSLAWDGTYLWALSSRWPDEGGDIYQYDISEARPYVTQKYEDMEKGEPVLLEILQQDPPDGLPKPGEGLVQIVNETSSSLRISFEKYNYSIEIAPEFSQTIKPPDDTYLAEVSGLPPLEGQYPFDSLIRFNYVWTFEMSK